MANLTGMNASGFLRAALLFTLGSCLGLPAAQLWTVRSPSGEIKVTVETGQGSKNAAPLYYSIEQGNVAVISRSPLGLRIRGHDSRLRFESAEAPLSIQESYTLVHGKRHACANSGRQLTLHFRSGDGLSITVDVRAYDNGVAFRHRLNGASKEPLTIEAEETGFALPRDAKLWCAPSDKASTYSPAYETYYENEMSPGTASPLGNGWSFPLLFRTADSRHWALITEAGVNGAFCGSRLSSTAADGVYRITFPLPAEGNGHGSVQPSSGLPWEMPWRVIVIGSSLGTIVESTLVTDVCPPAQVNDTSWIKPGRVAWSWWSDNPSPKDAPKQKAFVDLAAEMGWEYVLVDANWTIMENGNLQDVLRHAKEKGVGVLLWYNSGGPHNVVTEKPRDCLTYAPVRQFELELLQKWDVKGVKIDFFQSDKQEVMGLYEGILRDAAARKIMVNFHGCTLPRGWERTYPHLMSMEAVRGEECYIFDSQYPDKAPIQNTILPFTRNAVGPMDYTPAGLSDNRYPHKTTVAHELALTVVLETGWLHFADGVAAYRGLPPEPKEFLKGLPVAWDDTRFVDGYPGKFVVVARQKGNAWYFAGINAENRPQEFKVVPGTWLGAGQYKLRTIADGAGAREFGGGTQEFRAGGSFTVKVLPYGGFVAVLQPQS